LGTCTGCKLRW